MTSMQDRTMELPEITKDEPMVIPLGVPRYVDWREKGILTLVRNQGACRSCWAIVAILVVEAIWQLKYGKDLRALSPQMLVDCVQENPEKADQDSNGCYALSPLKAFEWLMNNEVYAEQDYPYQQKRGICKVIKQPSARVKIKKVKTINGGLRLEILRRVAFHPVAAVVDAYNEFVNLKDQIYEGPKKKPKRKPPLHAVAIIGYGSEGDGANAKNYWLIMSSWGENWGVRGVGRVCRDHMLGGRYLVRRISYPVV